MITLLSLFISVQIIYKTLSSVHGKTMYRVSITEQKIKQSFVFYLEYIRKHFILQDLSDVTTRPKYTCPTFSHCVVCALIFMKKTWGETKWRQQIVNLYTYTCIYTTSNMESQIVWFTFSNRHVSLDCCL